MKQLMLGNQAVARGLYEAGCRFVSSYPGTPSTEITEEVAKYEEVYAEWAPNEKVAMESALGASFAGARSFCAMKHVGLNVAADPLYTAAYTGVNGGMVIAVADDPGMHSSQNEQDSRHHAIASKVPMLEPSDSAECKEFIIRAFNLSEKFDTPVIFRTYTRIAHSQSMVELCDREEKPLKDYEKNPQKYSMSPANAIRRHVFVEERMAKLAEIAETCPLNRVEMDDTSIGFITSGTCYQYVKEVFPHASVLKLGLVNPLPKQLFIDFAAKVDKLYVIEEMDPIIEQHVRALGIHVDGGKDLTGLLGEMSQAKLRAAMGVKQPESDSIEEPLPVRPPVLCPGCPHRGLFYTLSKLKLTVCGDIGCYTLGGAAPLNAMDTTICMGASIGALHGFNKIRPDGANKRVAVIGDSTFMHSGMTGLANIVYNKSISTVLILDNSITGMTGHQQNPTTGLTLKEEPTYAIRMEDVAKALGIKRVSIVDPADLAALEKTIREEIEADEPSVVIVRRPCALLKCVKHKPPFKVETDKCKSCKMCMKLGCPAIKIENGKASIDTTLCVGCGLCQQMCKFDAIQE
ncbi:MAG: indolepyruvate ferredoxin oxidoreductase subunit alpha [Clostridia bacterium]|nr:indolepyruvate ferredoxin oxidoreductase subunit alpha [Clostridia bacterium]